MFTYFIFLHLIIVYLLFLHADSYRIILRQKGTLLFLQLQLISFRKANPKRKLHICVIDKIKTALLYKFLGCPKYLCYAFKPKTLRKWFYLLFKSPFFFLFNKFKRGRPSLLIPVKKLIIKLKRENPSWGVVRIQDELAKFLDKRPGKSTIYRILKKYGFSVFDPDSPWSKFIRSVYSCIYACDFKTVDTILGKRLYVLFIISYESRKIIHYNVTPHPSKIWIERQLSNINDSSRKLYLIRDNDQLFKHVNFEKYFIDDVNTSFQSPNMNPIIERFIGSFNHEVLNLFFIFFEKQLRFITKSYVDFYNSHRPHQSMNHSTLSQPNDQKKVLSKSFSLSKVRSHSPLCGVLNHYSYLGKAA